MKFEAEENVVVLENSQSSSLVAPLPIIASPPTMTASPIPKNWMPQVKDEARRLLEWETGKRMQLARTPLENIEAPSAQKVDTSFGMKRKRPSSEIPAYIEIFEAQLQATKVEEAESCQSKSAHRWATMIVDNYILLRKEKTAQQKSFNTAVAVLLRYQKRN